MGQTGIAHSIETFKHAARLASHNALFASLNRCIGPLTRSHTLVFPYTRIHDPSQALEWTIRIIPHTAGELPGAILASETTP